MRWLLLLVGVAGCDLVFELKGPVPAVECDPADPAFHDEDGDGIGDLCDNCPDTPNTDQLNDTEAALGLDEDDLGNLCDPRQSNFDRRIEFVSFDETGAATRWRNLRGSWAAMGGALVLETPSDQFEVVGDQKLMPTPPLILRARVAVTDAPTTADVGFHLLADLASGEAGLDGVGCGLFDNTIRLLDDFTGGGDSIGVPQPDFGEFILELLYEPGATSRCSLSLGDGTPLGTTSAIVSEPTRGVIGFNSQGLVMSVLSLDILVQE